MERRGDSLKELLEIVERIPRVSAWRRKTLAPELATCHSQLRAVSESSCKTDVSTPFCAQECRLPCPSLSKHPISMNSMFGYTPVSCCSYLQLLVPSVVSNVERVSTLMNALTGVLSKRQKKLKWRSYSGCRI